MHTVAAVSAAVSHLSAVAVAAGVGPAAGAAFRACVLPVFESGVPGDPLPAALPASVASAVVSLRVVLSAAFSAALDGVISHDAFLSALGSARSAVARLG